MSLRDFPVTLLTASAPWPWLNALRAWAADWLAAAVSLLILAS